MKYKTLLKEFFQEIPECKKLYEQKASQLLFDQDTGVHIVFGVLIVPYLIELINEGKKEEKLLERFFAFFEKMAKSEDENVVGVLDATILESLIDQGRDFLKIAKVYMGEETKKNCEHIELYFN